MADEPSKERPVEPQMTAPPPPDDEAPALPDDATVQAAMALDGAATASLTEPPLSEASEKVVAPAMVDRSLQAQLGQQLRALFDHVAAEPVPDRLLKLLEQLEDKEKQR